MYIDYILDQVLIYVQLLLELSIVFSLGVFFKEVVNYEKKKNEKEDR